MDREEVLKVERYMKRKFNCGGIRLQAKRPDHVEVEIDGEFVGTLHRDEEDNEVTYHFQMAILDIDLEE